MSSVYMVYTAQTALPVMTQQSHTHIHTPAVWNTDGRWLWVKFLLGIPLNPQELSTLSQALPWWSLSPETNHYRNTKCSLIALILNSQGPPKFLYLPFRLTYQFISSLFTSASLHRAAFPSQSQAQFSRTLPSKPPAHSPPSPFSGTLLSLL